MLFLIANSLAKKTKYRCSRLNLPRLLTRMVLATLLWAGKLFSFCFYYLLLLIILFIFFCFCFFNFVLACYCCSYSLSLISSSSCSSSSCSSLSSSSSCSSSSNNNYYYYQKYFLCFGVSFLAALIKGKNTNECIRLGQYTAREILQQSGPTVPSHKPDPEFL